MGVTTYYSTTTTTTSSTPLAVTSLLLTDALDAGPGRESRDFALVVPDAKTDLAAMLITVSTTPFFVVFEQFFLSQPSTNQFGVGAAITYDFRTKP